MARTLTAQYAAGLFDGEGSLGLYPTKTHKRLRPQLSVGVGHKPILDEMKLRYGGGIYLNKTRPGYRDSWQWRLWTKDDLLSFLNDVLPHLREKFEQAHLMQLVLLGCVPNDEHVARRLRDLKRVGVPSSIRKEETTNGK